MSQPWLKKTSRQAYIQPRHIKDKSSSLMAVTYKYKQPSGVVCSSVLLPICVTHSFRACLLRNPPPRASSQDVTRTSSLFPSTHHRTSPHITASTQTRDSSAPSKPCVPAPAEPKTEPKHETILVVAGNVGEMPWYSSTGACHGDFIPES